MLRTMQLLRGLGVGLGINYSCAEQWRPIAEEMLYKAGRLKGALSINSDLVLALCTAILLLFHYSQNNMLTF